MMPYHIEREGNKFKVVTDATGKVVGTHPTKIQAQAQLGALYANVPDSKIKKCMTCGCEDLGNDHHYISDTEKCMYCIDKGQGPCWDGYEYAGTKPGDNGKTVPNCIPVKKERGTIAGDSSVNSGRISGGVGWKIEFNTPDCQHGWAVIKVGSGQSIGCFFKEEDAKAALEALAVTEPIVKADGGYKPTSGMKSAAAKAIKWKEEGKANGAGTNVGWTRAHQIVSGESLSLDTVKRMYSFFSRHEVDKQGKEWDKPSHGKVMWYAWGGDAGYSWSRAIVERESKVEKSDEKGQVDQNNQEGIGALSFWNGSFAPVIGGQTSGSWMSTYNSPPQHDGKQTVGYGNHSDPKGRSNQ
jgi:hypothetical protein